jgi:hypothetical protein
VAKWWLSSSLSFSSLIPLLLLLLLALVLFRLLACSRRRFRAFAKGVDLEMAVLLLLLLVEGAPNLNAIV